MQTFRESPLFTGLCSEQSGLLVEAMGSVTRETVRMAIRQLADYSRFVYYAARAILLPPQPRKGLLDSRPPRPKACREATS